LPESCGRAESAATAVHKAERNAEKIYRAAIADAFAPEPYVSVLREGGPDGVAPAMERLLLALRSREIYRHLSNAADRLDSAGRALLDIVVEAD
jgi:hypothetical protein